MPSDLLLWAFYSPRRLLVVATGLVVGLVVVAALTATAIPSDSKTASAGTTRGLSTPVAATPAVVTSPRPSSTGAAQPAAVVVRRFIDAWLSGRVVATQAEWIDRVRPLVTPALAAAFRFTDRTRLPAASLRPDLVPIVSGEYLVTYRVDLTDGSHLGVVAVQQGPGWAVSDIEPDRQ